MLKFQIFFVQVTEGDGMVTLTIMSDVPVAEDFVLEISTAASAAAMGKPTTQPLSASLNLYDSTFFRE